MQIVEELVVVKILSEILKRSGEVCRKVLLCLIIIYVYLFYCRINLASQEVSSLWIYSYKDKQMESK